MSELKEITEGKTIEQLKKELEFQLNNGESLGGAICSHIQNEILKGEIACQKNIIL